MGAIKSSLESSVTSLNNGPNNSREQEGEGLKTTDLHVLLGNSNNVMALLKKSEFESGSSGLVSQTEDSNLLQKSRSGMPNFRHKGASLPLLDLHKDHDADSLPSPTRDLSAPLPFDKGLILERGFLKPEWPTPQQSPVPQQTPVRDKLALHPYETDALKAVSSYQQKFGWSSFSMNDNLPSPTPSEDGDTSKDGDTSGEVSSSVVHNVNHVDNTSIARPPAVSSTVNMDTLTGPEISDPRIVGPACSLRNSVMKSSAKRRDPRLRLVNSDACSRPQTQSIAAPGSGVLKSESLGVISSQKQKASEELVFDGPAHKRRRNELLGPSTTLPLVSASSPMTISTTTPPFSGLITSPLTSQNERLPTINPSTSASLNSLLRDIAVNPAIWMNILKMESRKPTDDVKNIAEVPNTNAIPSAIPSTTSTLSFPSTPQNTSAGTVYTSSQDESGKVRMKPRDPRRILHTNAHTPAGSDQAKMNAPFGLAVTDNLNIPRQEDKSEKNTVPSSGMKPPDIAMQFTSNLRNIADILSVSQASIPPAAPLQISSSQQVQCHQAGAQTKGIVTDSDKHKRRNDLTSDAAVVGPSQTLKANTWSDVEHLFEAFDDEQKAAIQRERARRLEEQKKMFAARKLSLVLDLDHTLLNSAKFGEVDPGHEETLIKKEEQDREKPQKHLFRFHHMSMWTKLRPGIWNFLEKASKLYELHLYTMGNRYYATEMAKLLDPSGDLFSGRVTSRGDDGELFDGDERVPKSKDLEGVLGMESGVVIIDDSVRVWPHNKLNLIVVERYIYFPCSRRQFGLTGPSLLEIDHDERPEDGTLASCLSVIERIHQNFFAHKSLDDADVRNILASEQRKILAGCRIVFSRIFPVGEANPHMHPVWQTAEQFGAVCVNQIDDQVTHVVANSLGTDKVNWALSTGRFVVHPSWVEASALLYRRANEHDFAIKQQ